MKTQVRVHAENGNVSVQYRDSRWSATVLLTAENNQQNTTAEVLEFVKQAEMGGHFEAEVEHPKAA